MPKIYFYDKVESFLHIQVMQVRKEIQNNQIILYTAHTEALSNANGP